VPKMDRLAFSHTVQFRLALEERHGTKLPSATLFQMSRIEGKMDQATTLLEGS
jgi:hypothetical protein